MATSSLSSKLGFSSCETAGMHHLSWRSAILVGLFLAAPAFSQTIIESRQTYELVADAAIETLPAPLRGWFIDRNALMATVFAHRRDRVNIQVDNKSGQQHFTWLQMPAPDKRNNRKIDFRSLLTVARIEGQSFTLVEMIQKQHATLIEAFRGGDATLITTTAGQLTHYVIDASLPSHVAVVEHDWRGRSATKTDKRIERLAFHESIVFDTRHERFVFEVRIWPKRLQDSRYTKDGLCNDVSSIIRWK